MQVGKRDSITARTGGQRRQRRRGRSEAATERALGGNPEEGKEGSRVGPGGGIERINHPSIHPSIYHLDSQAINRDIHPPIHQSNPRSVHRFIHVSIDSSIRPSIQSSMRPLIHPSVHQSNPRSVHQSHLRSVHQSNPRSVHNPIFDPSINPIFDPFIHPSIHPSLFPSTAPQPTFPPAWIRLIEARRGQGEPFLERTRSITRWFEQSVNRGAETCRWQSRAEAERVKLGKQVRSDQTIAVHRRRRRRRLHPVSLSRARLFIS